MLEIEKTILKAHAIIGVTGESEIDVIATKILRGQGDIDCNDQNVGEFFPNIVPRFRLAVSGRRHVQIGFRSLAVFFAEFDDSTVEIVFIPGRICGPNGIDDVLQGRPRFDFVHQYYRPVPVLSIEDASAILAHQGDDMLAGIVDEVRRLEYVIEQCKENNPHKLDIEFMENSLFYLKGYLDLHRTAVRPSQYVATLHRTIYGHSGTELPPPPVAQEKYTYLIAPGETEADFRARITELALRLRRTADAQPLQPYSYRDGWSWFFEDVTANPVPDDIYPSV